MERAVAKSSQEDVRRWTRKRKAALVLSIFRRETGIQEAARQHGITVAELVGLEGALPATSEECTESTSLGRRGAARGSEMPTTRHRGGPRSKTGVPLSPGGATPLAGSDDGLIFRAGESERHAVAFY